MRIILLIFVFVFLSVVASIFPQKAYGDGFTQENLPPANVGNRKISLFIKINPPIITWGNNQDRYLLFRWFDANTNQTIQHTTFLVEVVNRTTLLMQGVFHTHSGILSLRINPSNNPSDWKIIGTPKQFLDSYMYLPQGNGTIDLVAPILGNGGLYHIYVELITMDSDQNIFKPQDAPKFDAYLSVGDISNHTISYNGNSYHTEIISYYDKINNYTFDQSKIKVSWSIPFDWDTKRFQDLPIFVHEEVHFPKTFKEFASTPTYVANVNGNPITGRELVVDPYSLADTVVAHILLNKVDIENVAKKIDPHASTMDFEISPATANVQTSSSVFTDFGGWRIKLGWSTTTLEANTQNSLKLTFFDAFTEKQVAGDVNYDIKILDKDGSTVLSEAGLTAKGGSGTLSINLPNIGIYRIEINIKDIINNGLPDKSRVGVGRGDLVIPSTATEETVPEFDSLAEMIITISIIGVIAMSRKFRFHFSLN